MKRILTDKEEGRRYIIGAIVLLGLSLAAYFADDGSGLGRWFSVLPPILAVTAAFVTNRLLVSLGLAVFVGGIVHGVWQSETFFSGLWIGFWRSVYHCFSSINNEGNVRIVLFVALILAMVAIIVRAGGFQAILNWLTKYAKSSRSTQMVTVGMGLAIFIDDYANTMIVGSTMRSLSDRFRVSREKLAFLVDATSAPVAGIAAVSTWVGFEIGLFGDFAKGQGLTTNGYSMFFDALPYRFYCIFMIIFVIVNALSRRDFGAMARAQRRALGGEIFASDAKPMTAHSFSVTEAAENIRPLMRTAFVPLGVLFFSMLAGFWLDGGGLQLLREDSLALFSAAGWRDSIIKANNIKVLAYAALAGMLTAFIFSFTAGRLPVREGTRSGLSGFKSSLLPILILVFAWALKAICTDLKTGNFLVQILGGTLPPFSFPVLLFIVAGITSFGIGTSWGTMAILIPTALPVAYQLDGGSYGLVTMMSMAAVLDGSIFGDHCSPISDTTIMSSIASSCDHLHHVKTQIPYSLVVAGIAALVGYLPGGLQTPASISHITGAIIVVALLYRFGRRRDAPL